jgi:hypothetical protein
MIRRFCCPDAPLEGRVIEGAQAVGLFWELRVSVDQKAGGRILDDDWLAESVRVSVFVEGNSQKIGLLEVAGLAAEEVSERPAQGFRQESVGFQNGQLSLIQTPGRIDLVYGPKPNAFSAGEPLLHIGGFQTAINRLHPFGRQLCNKLAAIIRIAIAPIALRQVNSESDAASVIKQGEPALPIDPASDTDIVWQINRRRFSDEIGIAVNNISKWQAANVQIVPMGGPPLSGSSPLGPVIVFVRVELEVNTVLGSSSPRAFGESRQLSVYDEVYRLLLKVIGEKATS